MTAKDRNSVIDLLKAFGIVLMVFGHSGFPFTKFIYLFHMAIFFMASGFCFNERNSESFHDFVVFLKRKFLNLWIPYVVTVCLFTLLHNFFIKVHIYTIIPIDLTRGGGVTVVWSFYKILKNILLSLLLSGSAGQMGGALWFIAILMKISVLYCFIDFCLKKIIKNDFIHIVVQLILSILLLLIGFYFHIKTIEFLSLDKVFSYYILFFLGFFIKRVGLILKEGSNYFIHFTILIFSFFILSLLNRYGSIALDKTNYENPIFLILSSIMGFYFLWEISFFSQKVDKLSKLFIYIGQHTLIIVILHFLSFKLVTLIQIYIYREEIEYLSAFPVLYTHGGWWLFYAVIGIGYPLLTEYCFKRFVRGIKQRRTSVI